MARVLRSKTFDSRSRNGPTAALLATAAGKSNRHWIGQLSTRDCEGCLLGDITWKGKRDSQGRHRGRCFGRVAVYLSFRFVSFYFVSETLEWEDADDPMGAAVCAQR